MFSAVEGQHGAREVACEPSGLQLPCVLAHELLLRNAKSLSSLSRTWVMECEVLDCCHIRIPGVCFLEHLECSG